MKKVNLLDLQKEYIKRLIKLKKKNDKIKVSVLKTLIDLSYK